MITRAQKARLGVFLVVSLLMILAVFGVMVGQRVMEHRDRYTVKFDSTVSGLEVGAQVKYNGVRVGQVEKIVIDPEDISVVVVTLALNEGTPVKTDTTAVAASMGITGLKFIELTRGTNEASLIDPGGTIKAGTSTLDNLQNKAEAITAKVETILDNVIEFTSPENTARIEKIIANIEALTTEIDGLVKDNRENITTILDSAAVTSAEVAEVATTINTEVQLLFGILNEGAKKTFALFDKSTVDGITTKATKVLSSADKLLKSADIATVLTNTNELLTSTNNLISDTHLTLLQSKENLMSTLAYLLEGVENLNEISLMIKEDPSVLLTGSKLEERKTE